MRLFLFFISALFVSSTALGEDIDMSIVMQAASEFLGSSNSSIEKKSKSYCIIQKKDDVGYVIISLTGNSKNKIIGYSESSSWIEGKMPDALTDWLDYLDSCSSDLNEKNQKETSLYDSIERKSIKPLLTCHWHQNSPFNDLAPVISDGNVKTVAGCVAIAAAQIAYYWRKDNPEYTLKDTPVYPYGAAPVTYSIPKGSPNNWSLMKDSYVKEDTPESRYAVAQLCYVLGTTSYLNYASSTGGSINDASNSLRSQYNLLSEYSSKAKFTQQKWDSLIYMELVNGRPILCAGNDGGGHAFVLDGYNHQNNLYHFNFGWGGSGDGYYPIDDSETAMGGYSKNQAIVYNIQPQKRNINAMMEFCASEERSLINIIINIENSSTLDIKGLQLYLVPKAQTIHEVADPIWKYSDSVKCDGTTQQIVAYNLHPLEGQESVFYLTDDNKSVICELHMQFDSKIEDIQKADNKWKNIYDIHGKIIKKPAKGVSIVDWGSIKKKIFINN